MNAQRVHLQIDLAVRDGKFAEFEQTVAAMAAGTAKEPGALGYEFYLSDDRRSARLLETYADAAALQAHFAGPVVRELVPKLLASASVERFEVYGRPSAETAATLAAFGARIYPHWRGLPQ